MDSNELSSINSIEVENIRTNKKYKLNESKVKKFLEVLETAELNMTDEPKEDFGIAITATTKEKTTIHMKVAIHHGGVIGIEGGLYYLKDSTMIEQLDALWK